MRAINKFWISLYFTFLSFTSISLSQELPSGPRLKDIGNRCLIGSMIHHGHSDNHGVINDNSKNNIYTKIAREEFNLIQTTWYPKGNRWAKNKKANFDQVNRVINWGVKNNKRVMVHMLTGYDLFQSEWFINEYFTPTQLDSLLKSLIYQFMESNNNHEKVDIWNVANELLSFDNSGKYHENLKWAEMGWEEDESCLSGPDKINDRHPVFIGKALQYCRNKTDAILELRDYFIENNDPKSDLNKKHKAFYQLVKHLQAKGYPLDAVGIQGHFDINRYNLNFSEFNKSVRKFKLLGLDVYLTELDIATEDWNEKIKEKHGNIYYQIVREAITSGVNLISLWGFRDGNDPNWLDGKSPLIFEENYQVKPAYFGIQQALYDTKDFEFSHENTDLQLPTMVHPNPAKELINLEITSFDENENIQVNIFNTLGSLCLSTQIECGSPYVDIGTLPAGHYVVNLNQYKYFALAKFIKH